MRSSVWEVPFFLRSQSSVCHQIIRMFGLPDGFSFRDLGLQATTSNVKSSARNREPGSVLDSAAPRGFPFSRSEFESSGPRPTGHQVHTFKLFGRYSLRHRPHWDVALCDEICTGQLSEFVPFCQDDAKSAASIADIGFRGEFHSVLQDGSAFGSPWGRSIDVVPSRTSASPYSGCIQERHRTSEASSLA